MSFVLSGLSACSLIGATTGTLTWIGPSSGGSWDDAANWSSTYSAGTFSDWQTGSGYVTTYNFSSLADGAGITTGKAKLRIGGLVLPSSSGVWTFTGNSSAMAVFGTDVNTPLEVSVPSGGKVVWRIKVPLDTSNATDCGFNLRGGGSFCIDAEFRPYSKKKQIRAYDGTVVIGANMPSSYNEGLVFAGISLIDNKGRLTLERDTCLGQLWSTPGNSQHMINLNGHTLYVQYFDSSLAGVVQGGGTIEFRSGRQATVDNSLAGNAFYHASRGFVTNKVAFPSGSVIGASMGGQIVLKGNQTVAGLCGTGTTAQVAVRRRHEPGARGKCLGLGGNASLKLESLATDLPAGKASFTLAVRFVQKTTALDSAIVGWGDFSTANRFFCAGVYQDPRVNFVSWNQPRGASFADKSGPLSCNDAVAHAWDTYVYVKETNSAVRVYREGVLLTRSTWDVSNIDISPQDFYVGYRPSNGKYFTGAIDDIRIYGEALTEREVALLTLDMKTDDPFASTLPPTTDLSVSSAAAV